jgi:2-dehydro-3-deoxyphosphooctonate aldolase (KDO 8-P synthase)
MRSVSIGAAGVPAGPGEPLLLIAGPCLIEDEPFMLDIAHQLRELAAAHGAGLVFKSSFDKANRPSVASHRGPGIEAGLELLATVRDQVGVPVTTDLHESSQAAAVGEAVDLLQIPAFLCRQTDLLLAAAQTGKPVNVKKGQFLSPPEMRNVVGKLEEGGASGILLTERGTTFGYNNLVVDFRALPQMRALGHPVVFDATHSVQLPGGQGTSSGGQREFVPYLTRAAAAVGIDGVFVEVHPDPDRAPSDGPNMLTPPMLDRLLDELTAIRSAVSEHGAPTG